MKAWMLLFLVAAAGCEPRPQGGTERPGESEDGPDERPSAVDGSSLGESISFLPDTAQLSEPIGLSDALLLVEQVQAELGASFSQELVMELAAELAGASRREAQSMLDGLRSDFLQSEDGLVSKDLAKWTDSTDGQACLKRVRDRLMDHAKSACEFRTRPRTEDGVLRIVLFESAAASRISVRVSLGETSASVQAKQKLVGDGGRAALSDALTQRCPLDEVVFVAGEALRACQ